MDHEKQQRRGRRWSREEAKKELIAWWQSGMTPDSLRAFDGIFREAALEWVRPAEGDGMGTGKGGNLAGNR